MELSLRRMAKHGGRHLLALQGLLQMSQKNRKRCDRYGDVFDAGRGPRRTLRAVERRDEPLSKSPVELKVRLVLSHVRSSRQSCFELRDLDHFVELFEQLVATVGMMFDQQ